MKIFTKSPPTARCHSIATVSKKLQLIEDVRYFMNKYNLKGTETSRILGVSSSVVSSWLTGHSKPTLNSMSKYRKAMREYVKAHNPNRTLPTQAEAEKEKGDQEAISQVDLGKVVGAISYCDVPRNVKDYALSKLYA